MRVTFIRLARGNVIFVGEAVERWSGMRLIACGCDVIDISRRGICLLKINWA